MRPAVAPRYYSVQLSSLANLMRTVAADKRMSHGERGKIQAAIDEITEVLISAQRKPFPAEPST
jgi:hypothetical protein